MIVETIKTCKMSWTQTREIYMYNYVTIRETIIRHNKKNYKRVLGNKGAWVNNIIIMKKIPALLIKHLKHWEHMQSR